MPPTTSTDSSTISPDSGGSHAQREVFEDTILESYIRAERFDKAQELLHTRLKRRTSVRDEVWLQRTGGGGLRTSVLQDSTARDTLNKSY